MATCIVKSYDGNKIIGQFDNATGIVVSNNANGGITQGSTLVCSLPFLLGLSTSANGALKYTPKTTAQTVTETTLYASRDPIKISLGTGIYTLSTQDTIVRNNIQVTVASDVKNQSKTVTPTTSKQTVTPDSGYSGLNPVIVNAIPAKYKDTSDATIVDGSQLLTGYTAYGQNGKVIGSMPKATSGVLVNNAAGVIIPKGYYDGTLKATVNLQSKTISPKATSQTVTPDSGQFLSSVTVDPIPISNLTYSSQASLNKALVLDFSKQATVHDNYQSFFTADGYYADSIDVMRPDTLIPDNIPADVTIAGIAGGIPIYTGAYTKN